MAQYDEITFSQLEHSLATTQANVNHSSSNLTVYTRDENLAKVEIAVEATMVILAAFGNGLVLLVLSRKRKRFTRMNMLIMNLCLADLFLAFFNMFPQLCWDITYTFKGENFLCKFVKYAQIVAMYAASYVLVMTAIDRYIAIVHPMVSQTWTTAKVHIMVSIAWGLSLIFSIPQALIFSMKINQYGLLDCWATFQPEWTLTAYVTWFCVAIYLVPFIILVFCYGSICFVVWKSMNNRDQTFVLGPIRENGNTLRAKNGMHYKVHSSAGPRAHGTGNVSKAKVRTVKLTLTVVLCYLLCWGPFFVSQMWAAWDPFAPFTGKAMTIILLLTGVNSCVNPWIYMIFTDNICAKVQRTFRGKHMRHNNALQASARSIKYFSSTGVMSFRE